MSLRSIALTALVFLGGWYWLRTRELKDRALKAAAAHCHNLSLKLLDDSVVLRGIRFHRDKRGKMCVLRKYQFDFTSTGDDRYQGVLIMHGVKVEQIKLPAHRVD